MFDWRTWRKGKSYEQIFGRKQAKEIKRKQSKAHEGMQYSERRNRKVSKSHIGLRHSKESRRKISRALMGNTNGEGTYHNHKGKNNPCWQGGISREPYGWDFNPELKRRIRRRDNHTCQLCGVRGRTVHHIDYDKENNEEDNLITLCNDCNLRVNHDRDYWQEYFEEMMMCSIG